MILSRRRLPHIYRDQAVYFVTARLWGTHPIYLPSIQTGRDFAAYDILLNDLQHSPTWLRHHGVARLACQSLVHLHRIGDWTVHEFVIMPNHVHLLVETGLLLGMVMGRWKRFVSLRANRLLQRQGQPFWMRESFDRVVRSHAEQTKTAGYIRHNPVVAGWVKSPEDWPWSSAHPEWQQQLEPQQKIAVELA